MFFPHIAVVGAGGILIAHLAPAVGVRFCDHVQSAAYGNFAQDVCVQALFRPNIDGLVCLLGADDGGSGSRLCGDSGLHILAQHIAGINGLVLGGVANLIPTGGVLVRQDLNIAAHGNLADHVSIGGGGSAQVDLLELLAAVGDGAGTQGDSGRVRSSLLLLDLFGLLSCIGFLFCLGGLFCIF